MTQTRYIASAAMFGLLAAAYFSRGIYFLVFATNVPQDLWQRYRDQIYILDRQNPYDVLFANQPIGRNVPLPPPWRSVAVDPRVGAPVSEGYPPWAFFSSLLFTTWPAWPILRTAFAAWNVIGLIVIAFWVWTEARRRPDSPGPTHSAPALSAEQTAFLVCASLALAAYCTTLGVGNYGIISVAFLAACVWLARRGWQTAAGIAMGIAMIKPQIAGPFVLALLWCGLYRAFWSCVAYLVATSCIIWFLVHTSPLEMMGQMLHGSDAYVADSYSLLNFLLARGVEPRAAVPLTALLILVAASILHWRYRSQGLLAAFAIASVAGRLFTYHKTYDNCMVLFLLVALGLAMMRTGSRWHCAAFLLVGASLWLPATLTDRPWFQLLQIMVWIFGLIVLLLRPAICNTASDAPSSIASLA